MACFGDQLVQETKGFGGQAKSAKRKSSKKRKPGTSNHRRDQCPMGRDPGLEAIQARQCLGLPLTGRLTVAQVKRAHKLLAVQHHPDKGHHGCAFDRVGHASASAMLGASISKT